MTTSPRRPVRRALVASVALAVAGLPLLSGGSAVAASVPLTYHCTTSPNLGEYDLSAVVDTNAPATLGAGMTVPITVTSDVTIPETLANLLRLGGVATVEGTSQSTGTVDGAGRVADLVIPKTTVPATGTPMHVIGTGPGGLITGGAVGSSILIAADGFVAKLTGRNTAGDVVVPETTFTCGLAPAGQNQLVDTVSVVQTTTTTTLSVGGPVEYGDVPTASVEVAQAGSNSKPSGSVALTYGGKTVTVEVKGGKAKTALPPALTVGTNQVTAVFTPDKGKLPSQATATFTVVRGSTTTTASAAVRDADHRLTGKAHTTSVHGTDVTGKVKFTLKRNGTKIRSAIVTLNAKDRAKKAFVSIAKPGTYLVVVKYLGSPTLKRSTGRVKLTVL